MQAQTGRADEDQLPVVEEEEKMTTKEKASRYDALQAAIEMTIKLYEEEISKAPTANEVCNNLIKACEFGRASAYAGTVKTMKRWIQ